LASPPSNLFYQKLMEDLRTAADHACHRLLKALLVRADGKNFTGGSESIEHRA
jgi:hypothetical protein